MQNIKNSIDYIALKLNNSQTLDDVYIQNKLKNYVEKDLYLIQLKCDNLYENSFRINNERIDNIEKAQILAFENLQLKIDKEELLKSKEELLKSKEELLKTKDDFSKFTKYGIFIHLMFTDWDDILVQFDKLTK